MFRNMIMTFGIDVLITIYVGLIVFEQIMSLRDKRKGKRSNNVNL